MDALSQAAGPTVVADDVGHRFRGRTALEDVSVGIRPGELHALLGPNGAGKTTLLRILAGLIRPDEGSVAIAGIDAARHPRRARDLIGFMPPGERTLYHRLSGRENLIFFARLRGLTLPDAKAHADELLEAVGLDVAADLRCGKYSQGMKKRLSFARALIADPQVLLIDEATHDLDPKGAERVRRLARVARDRGAAIVWATQRLEEIRGFADRVTLLASGSVRFQGSVYGLVARAPRRFVLQIGIDGADPERVRRAIHDALVAFAELGVERLDDDHYAISLPEDVVLGDVIASLWAARIRVLACREDKSPVEAAFLLVTRGDSE